MRPISGVVLTAVLLSAALRISAQIEVEDPHGDPETGVLRVTQTPSTRGQCQQCHPLHGTPYGVGPFAPVLFAENNNDIAFWDEGEAPCHQKRPDNYPLDETDRMPESQPDPGYFEANAGGIRRKGVQYRGRWPGERVYTTQTVTAEGHFFSPHAQDPDMPKRDDQGQGSCLNCHDPHGTPRRDLLVATYGGIGGHTAMGPPGEYALCLSCHGAAGPAGMEPENRRIEDFYDPVLNQESAGHQIRMNPQIALSWPSYVQQGDMLPCYDCHDPHGSEGNNQAQPNAFVLSDERPEWSGLTDPVHDAAQCRRFCFGCHIPSDGVPGLKTVEGIIMNTLSAESGHEAGSAQSCYDCHGSDYAESTSHNVHNPGM